MRIRRKKIFDKYHEPLYTPTNEDLKEVGFELDDIDLWVLVAHDHDVCGVNMPCMITYHPKINYFLLGGNYFSPPSKEALKTVIESFRIGPNRKITEEINRKEFPYLYKK